MSLSRMRALLGRSETVRHLFLSSSGSAAVPIINLAFIPIVMRIYGPAEYGLWVLLMSIVAILGTIAALRFEVAIVMADNDRQAGQVVLLSMLSTASIATLAAVGTWFARDAVDASLGRWWWVIPLLIGLLSVFQVGSFCCTRLRAFGITSASLVTRVLGMNLAQVLSPALGVRGEAGLVIGSIVGYAGSAALLVLGVGLKSHGDFFRGLCETRPIPELARRFRNFPLFSVPYTLMGTLKQEGSRLLFGGYGSQALVGDFGFAARLTGFPVTILGAGIRPVVYQKTASSKQVRDTQPFLETLLYGLSLLTIPPFLGFVVHTEEIFHLMLGEAWLGAVIYAKILAVPALAFLHTNWMDRILDTLQRQRLALVLETSFAACGLAGLTFGLYVLRNPVVAVSIQSGVLLGSCVCYIVVVYRVGKLNTHGLARYGLCFSLFAAVSLALTLAMATLTVWFVAAPAAVLLSYGVGALLLKHEYTQRRRNVRPASEFLQTSANALGSQGGLSS